MNVRLTMIAAVILLFGFAVLTWHMRPPSTAWSARSRNPDFKCAMIHEPRPLQGCPAGYEREKKPRFTEKDGSHEFACVDTTGKKERCIDFLKPGEGVGFSIEIEVQPSSPPGGPTT